MNFLPSVWPIVIGVGLITVFYDIFKTRWPDLYFSISDRTSFLISASPIRFLGFRMLPVMLIIGLVLAFYTLRFPSLGLSQWGDIALGSIIAATHAVFTNLRAIWRLVRRRGDIKRYFNIYSQIAYHLFTFVIVVFSGALGGIIAKTSLVRSLIPSWSGVVDDLWASIIGGAIVVYLLKSYENNLVTNYEIFNRSLQRINPELVKIAETEALNHNANLNLIKAVLTVENIQRPDWFRILERLKSFFIPQGSYGLMQVNSEKFISDEESIRRAILEYFTGTKDIVDTTALRPVIEQYNPSDEYVKMVLEAYGHFTA